MFIYNLKVSKNTIIKIFISVSILIISAIILYSFYLIFIKTPNSTFNNDDEIIEINEKNYTNILKASNEDIDSYIGKKFKITGYVYRLLDFTDNQFVIARNMMVNENSSSIIVGFLCEYNKASLFPDDTWVQLIGKLEKGNYNGDIAMLKVLSITKTEKPENIFVLPPDKTYIPTTYIF